MSPFLKNRYILFYVSIYLRKESSCNIAGDGPQTQWDQFVKSGIILSTDACNVYIGMHNNGGGDCFYYSILQLRDLFMYGIVSVTDLRLAIWHFVVKQEYELCKEIYEAFRASNDNDSYEEFSAKIIKPHEWACSSLIIIMSIFLQTDIIVITNEINITDGTKKPGLFKTSTACNDRLNIQSNLILTNDKIIYIYQHVYNKPLQPAPLIQLDHFCALRRRPRKPEDPFILFNDSFELSVYIINNDKNNDALLIFKGEKRKRTVPTLKSNKRKTQENIITQEIMSEKSEEEKRFLLVDESDNNKTLMEELNKSKLSKSKNIKKINHEENDEEKKIRLKKKILLYG